MYANRSEAPLAHATLVQVLSLIAPLFSYLTEEEYGDVCRNPAWCEVEALDAAGALGAGEEDAARWREGLALPAWPVRSLLQNEVLVAGMPLAALPVESLYKPWSAAAGNGYGAQRGLYLGDAARHIASVYAELEIEVPPRFAAAPDHLTLELELLALYLRGGNGEAARDFVRDHLDWLGDYDAALAARADGAVRSEALDGDRRAALAKGIDHLRALAALVAWAGEVAKEAMRPASAP